MQARLTSVFAGPSCISATNSRAFPRALSVSAGKAASVILTCGNAWPAAAGRADAIRFRIAFAVSSMAPLDKPLAAAATPAPARTPIGMISMPVASIPRPAATSAVVPIPAKGSSTRSGLYSSSR